MQPKSTWVEEPTLLCNLMDLEAVNLPSDGAR
jgi:hypothetical protein